MNIKEKLDKGYIQSRAIIEVLGKPKEHVEAALKQHIEKLKKQQDMEIIKQEIQQAEESKDEDKKGFWSVFAEIELLAKNLPVLVDFCFDYMPSSVEIIEPNELKLKQVDISGLLNDLQARLHKSDMAVKQLHNENQFIKLNTQNLLRNFISLLLLRSELTAEQLSQFVGLGKKEIEKFMNIMLKENKIKKDGDKYILVQNDK